MGCVYMYVSVYEETEAGLGCPGRKVFGDRLPLAQSSPTRLRWLAREL